NAALARQESIAQAEQIAVEDAKSGMTSWLTSAAELGAYVPYDRVIKEVMAVGREGGPLARLSLFAVPVDVTFSIDFDEKALEALATSIDDSIGDDRTDATVTIEEGVANAVKGHDGMMVDREWLSGKLGDALLSSEDEPSFVAEVKEAPSRTTYGQAQKMSASINQALNAGLTFLYQEQSWMPDAKDIGTWTRVKVAQASDGYELKVGIDNDAAASDLVKHLDATVDSNNVIVDFEKNGDEVVVKTSGSGIIPEIGPAVEQIGQILYGAGGLAWGGDASSTTIQVNESNAPEQLSVEQAIDLGLIMVIGEYTTEFSNAEGTENRNHNIRLASDLISNSIAESNGGKWSFNENSGDTNQDPPFASAGSIVNGEYVDSIGGGICQVATTVFNAVYEAGLDIVERRNHSLYIASYPTGRDAAVSYPEMDLIWSNPLSSDVLLQMSYTETTVTAKIYGVPTGYKVSTETGQWEEGESYKTEFETDDDLAEGSYYQKTVGSDGSQIGIMRTVTDINGNVVKQDSFTSIYSPKNEVYVIGPGTDTSKLMHKPDSESGGDSWDEDYDDDNETSDGYYDEGAGQQYYDESSGDEAYDAEGEY
ncbi:MAG: VanW family protein, partial [Eggerthellaceae bacterium]|nr:VanW family protein [Eggerthellaceae bacterium]